MEKDLLSRIAEKFKNQKQHSRWTKVVTAMACMVVFCTTYVLILPAITAEGQAYCGMDEHLHTEACMEQQLVCELEETVAEESVENVDPAEAAVVAEDADSVENLDTVEEADITEPVDSVKETHVHDESCYESVQTCTSQEHEHVQTCYADENADVESEEQWKQTLPTELTGDVREDLIAVAKSQIGYAESTKNYETAEDGSVNGYTRYGQWYGEPYADWSEIFALFCINYAEVENYPTDANAEKWMESLKETDYYHSAGDYTPVVGDLIFFDSDGDEAADSVGIVTDVNADNGDVQAIFGDYEDSVQYVTLAAGNSGIAGYAKPVEESKDTALAAEQQAEVDAVIALIDELPDVDTVEQTLAEYEEDDNMSEYENYYQAVGQQGRAAYEAYDDLSEEQQAKVTNSDKLFDLEWLWSAVTLIDEIISDDPGTIKTASTNSFIDLNLYDYTSAINDKYYDTDTITYNGYTNGVFGQRKTSKYPGFQWNGGAYNNSDYTKRSVDYIDFGNSMITDYDYKTPSTANGKSASSTDIAINDNWADYTSNSAKRSTLLSNINLIDVSTYGVTNRPVGMSLNSSITSQYGTYDILQRTLKDGYPALRDGTSLGYLFTHDGSAVIKQNSKSIDGLFELNDLSGAFSYNSRENHAQYNDVTETFEVYNQIITPNFIVYPFGNFLPFNDILSDSTSTQVSKIDNMATYVNGTITDLQEGTEDATETQLIYMLNKYKNAWGTTALSNLDAAEAINDYFSGNEGNIDEDKSFKLTDSLLKKMYNIDWDVDTNFFFGMDMSMRLMQPKDGLTGNDNGNNKTGTWEITDDGTRYRTGEPDGIPDYPMVFDFSGDDDVWVYIDDVLFLDLTGIHRHVGGRIDFTSGKVYYFNLDTENTGDTSEIPGEAYQTYTFEELYEAAGKDPDDYLTAPGEKTDANGKDYDSEGRAVRLLKDYSVHDFKFYYMERGSGSSVCRMNFNFPILEKNTISIAKKVTEVEENADMEDVLGGTDYLFQVFKADEDGNKTDELLVTKANNYPISIHELKANGDVGDKIRDGYVENYGIIRLKANEVAVIHDVPESAGKYYVREIFDKDSTLDQYGTVYVNGTPITEVTDTKVTGLENFTGYESNVKDLYEGSTLFTFDNVIDWNELGKLNITKEYNGTDKDKEFTFNVSIGKEIDSNGEEQWIPVPVGTKYIKYGSDGSKEELEVKEAGIIKLKAGERATISNIIAGSKFHVTEVTPGYIVDYSVNHPSEDNDINFESNGVSGVIKTDYYTGEVDNDDKVTTPTEILVTVTNNDNGAEVEIPVKKSILNPDNQAHTYKFNLVQVTDSSGETLVTDGTSMSGEITLPAKDGTASVVNLFTLSYVEDVLLDDAYFADDNHVEYFYKITEQTDTTETTVFDDTVYVVKVTVKKNGKELNSKLTAKVTGLWIDGSETSIQDGISVEFTNTLIGDLEISKTVDGNYSAGEKFDFTVTLKKGTVDLAEAYKFVSGGEDATEQDLTFNPVKDEDGKNIEGIVQATIPLAPGETGTIKGLPVGTEWTVEEAENNDYFVSITVDDVVQGDLNESVRTANGSITAAGTEVKVAYTNTTAYELPNTGGSGTTMFMIGGMALVAIAAVMYINKGRKKEDFL